MYEKQDVKVEQARYTDVPSVRRTGADAFQHDPLRLYLVAKRTDVNISSQGAALQALGTDLRRVMAYAEYGYYVHYRSAFTIDHGVAFVTIERPRPGKVKSLVKRILDTVFLAVNDRRRTPEQRKRWKEFTDKTSAATKAAFGDGIENMLTVVYLATSPQHQGQGYATALVTAANAEADRLGCSSWLLSSNIANTPFYESCGFKGVKEVVMGDNNPTWTKQPFKMLIMMRVGGTNASNAKFDEKWLPL